MTTMMKCGDAASGKRQSDGAPVCVVHVGLTPDAEVVNDSPPDLTGRMSTCGSCKRTSPSSPRLAFFGHRPDQATDRHYDGCRGWD